jgi:hypothetical protein
MAGTESAENHSPGLGRLFRTLRGRVRRSIDVQDQHAEAAVQS